MNEKSILITGTSSGIGLASTRLFAEQGWRVYATVRKQVDKKKLEQLGYANIHPVIVDINDSHSIAGLKERLQSELNNGLDVLVNNAAISQSAPFEMADDHHIRSQIETNVTNTFILTRELLPLVKKARGRIVSISSGSGVVSTPLYAVYSATKYAVEGFSDALRVELKRSGVKVILIEPGVINTPIHSKIKADYQQQAMASGEQGWGEYSRSMEANEAMFSFFLRYAPKPEAAAMVIYRSAIARRAKARYKVGPDVKFMLAFASFMPAKVRDYMWKILLKI